MTLHPGWPAVSGAATFQNIRRDISGTVVKSAANVIRKGILPITTTALVTGTATMNVAVGAFYAVLDRNGVVYVHNDGSVNVLLSSAPGSGSRWSVVYVKQRESESPFSDGATGPVLDKVESVTSEAAARALLPAGALELAVIQVNAGSANTNAVGVTITQTVLYTAMEGGTVLLRNATEQTGWTPHAGSEAYRLDLGLRMVFDGTTWVGMGSHHAGRSGGAIAGITVPGGAATTGLITKTGQWVGGTTVAFGNEYFPNITFPTAFPTACLHISITPLSGSPVTSSAGNPIALDTLDTTQFRALISGSGSPWVRGFTWFAVGY